MPLINCPACSREISTEAEACPQCGHPNRRADREPEGPKCYTCDSAATTRCVSCGRFSCPLHLKNIYVYHSSGGANELRCESCYSSARAGKLVVWGVFCGIIGFSLIFALVMWSQMGR